MHDLPRLAVFTLLAASAFAAPDPRPLTTVGEVAASLRTKAETVRSFDITARVTYVRTRSASVLAVEDSTDAAIVAFLKKMPKRILPGMRVRLSGAIRQLEDCRRAEAASVTILAQGPAPSPRDASLREILGGRLDCRLVRVSGEIRDCCRSETNPKWTIFVISEGGTTLCATMPAAESANPPFDDLVGASVSLTGIVRPGQETERIRLGR